MDKDRLIPRYGGYRKLRSFQTAQLVYDETVVFCNRFVDKRSRTHDQMVQAARSGVQNIAEGSMASATSKKFELKLVGVARASLEELILDYQDFLRQRGLRLWSKDAPEALKVRERLQWMQSGEQTFSAGSDPLCLNKTNSQVAANIMICLTNQASYLLGRQLQKLEKQFASDGGFTERLYHFRNGQRKRYAR